jgi:hypothetical protein
VSRPIDIVVLNDCVTLTKVMRCNAPAVRGWTVCRFHGAHGGAPKGKANGAYKHGLYTAEAKEERRLLADLLRQSRKAIAALPCEEEQ